MPETSPTAQPVATVTLPCGDEPPTFDTVSGLSIPIGLTPRSGLSAEMWCHEHGWVDVTDEQFAAIKEHFGDIA